MFQIEIHVPVCSHIRAQISCSVFKRSNANFLYDHHHLFNMLLLILTELLSCNDYVDMIYG